MWIKPELTFETNWSDYAANSFFTLQKKSSFIQKTLYRIVLLHQDNQYVISKSTSLKEIHESWNWIESNLILKLSHVHDLNVVSSFLFNEFDIMTQSDSEDEQVYKLFGIEESCLGKFEVFTTKDLASSDLLANLKGTFCVTQFHCLFWSTNYTSKLLLEFKDVTKIEQRNEQISISHKSQDYYFIFPTQVKKAYEVLDHLCNNAMRKLVQKTEAGFGSRSNSVSGILYPSPDDPVRSIHELNLKRKDKRFR